MRDGHLLARCGQESNGGEGGKRGKLLVFAPGRTELFAQRDKSLTQFRLAAAGNFAGYGPQISLRRAFHTEADAFARVGEHIAIKGALCGMNAGMGAENCCKRLGQFGVSAWHAGSRDRLAFLLNCRNQPLDFLSCLLHGFGACSCNQDFRRGRREFCRLMIDETRRLGFIGNAAAFDDLPLRCHHHCGGPAGVRAKPDCREIFGPRFYCRVSPPLQKTADCSSPASMRCSSTVAMRS